MTSSARHDDDWTRRLFGSTALAATVHVALFGLVLLASMRVKTIMPPPMVVYTVELTDGPTPGGRLPSLGPKVGERTSAGRSAPPVAKPAAPKPPPAPAAPRAKVAPVPPAPPPTPKKAVEPVPATAPAVNLAVPAKPVAEPETIAKKPAPVAKAPDAQAKSAAPAEPAPVEKAAPDEARTGSAVESGESASAAPDDAYAAAASRWRDRVRGDGSAPGPIGTGGGTGGGGTVVGLAFLAYRQQVVERIKEHWSTAVRRPGLLSRVQFQIAPNGAVANVRLAHSSGDRVYDETAVRAVRSVERLPPPPPEYVDAFREFMIEFHADEVGGGGG